MSINPKTLTPILFTLIIASCTTKQPYEDAIIKAFESNAKVVPIIELVTIDTIADITSYRDYHLSKANDFKDLSREFIERHIKDDTESLAKWKELHRQSTSAMSARHIRQNEADLRKNKQALENLDSVYKAEPYIVNLVRLSESTGTYKGVTVKFKLSKDGVTQVDNFIISPDSTVFPMDEKLDRFLKVTLPGLKF